MADNVEGPANSRPETSSARGVAPPPAAEPWQPKANIWVIGVVVALAAFMEVLDTSIANVALPYMAGSLGASNDESTWVLTSYLVSNAIVLPISGWFAMVFGRKRFFMMCLVIFTVSSLLCGIAPSLGAIILFRVIQGAGGGGLQPMAQAILADTFPPRLRGVAFALYGITTIVAPTIGPTLGGWITDNYTWRWIFFINLPVGIVALFLVYRLIEDPPWVKRAKGAGIKIDYIGVGLLTLGVGALQVMLDKGQEDDWFGSHFILTLAVIAGVCLVSLAIWEWFYKAPIIEVRLFKNLNFLGANAMMFILGIMLFSSLVMMPQFLQTLMGYTAESAGLVLSGGGLLLLFLMPDRRDPHVQSPGALPHRFWLAHAFPFHVLHHPASRPGYQFSVGQHPPRGAGIRPGFPVRSHQPGLVRRNADGEEQQYRRPGQLHAQHRKQHRNVDGHHADCAPGAVPPGVSGGAHNAGKTHLYLAVKALAARLAASGLDITRASSQAYGRIYGALIGQATTLAYIDTFWVLAVGRRLCSWFPSRSGRMSRAGAERWRSGRSHQISYQFSLSQSKAGPCFLCVCRLRTDN